MYPMDGSQPMSGLAAGKPVLSSSFDELNALQAELESLPQESLRRELIQARIDQLTRQQPPTSAGGLASLKTRMPTASDPMSMPMPPTQTGAPADQRALAALRKAR